MTESSLDAPLASGQFDLFIPAGFDNLMEPREGGYDEGTREMFSTRFPSATEADLDALVNGSGIVHESMRDHGITYHSLASVPEGTVIDGEVYGNVNWMFLAQVVEVPVTGEIDTGALAARTLGTTLTDRDAEVVSFDSPMGWGVGILMSAPLPDVSAYVEAYPELVSGTPRAIPESLTIAATITGAAGQAWGLLCTGYALEPRYKMGMASVVAAMGQNSSVIPQSADSELDDTAQNDES